MLVSGRMSFVDKIKSVQDKINKGIDNGIKGYNDKIDSIKKPTVNHELSPNTMLLIVGLVFAFLMFRKK